MCPGPSIRVDEWSSIWCDLFFFVLKQPSQGSVDGQAHQRLWVCVDAQVLWSVRFTHSLIQSFRLQPKAATNVSCGKQTNKQTTQKTQARTDRKVWGCMEARQDSKDNSAHSLCNDLFIYKMDEYRNSVFLV